MNKAKLKEAEEHFLLRFPGGFSHPRMVELAKKHKIEKMELLAQTSFAVEQFVDGPKILDSMLKVVSQSSLVSIFEKPKFRDWVKSLSSREKEHFSQGLKEFFHGDQECGFDLMTGLLQEYKLAKWPLLTVCPVYYRPEAEVFIKPTTTKRIIEYFELTRLKYSPQPTYAFYQAYRTEIMAMKQAVHGLLQVSNAAFCGFLMMSLEDHLPPM